MSILFALVFSEHLPAEVSSTQSMEGTERIVILENERLRLVVFPDLGGRIGHLIDKADGNDLLYWDLTPGAIYQGEGGVLDDRRNTFEPYVFEPTGTADGQKAALNMTFSSPEITIKKSLTLQAGCSTIQVDYVLQNTSQGDLTDYNVMTKNWLFPAGGPRTPQDVYCLPTSRGVRRIQGFSGNWGQFPELRGKFKQDVGSWNAIASSAKNRGIAIAFSNDYYRWFYYWKDGIDIPTYEWVFGDLPAGQQVSVSLWIHVVRGMDGFSYANRYLAADTRYDETTGQLKTEVFSAESPLKEAKLETEIQCLPIGLPERLQDMAIGNVPLAGVSQASSAWKPQAPGTYVVRQRLLEGRTIFGEFEEPLVHRFINSSQVFLGAFAL